MNFEKDFEQENSVDLSVPAHNRNTADDIEHNQTKSHDSSSDENIMTNKLSEEVPINQRFEKKPNGKLKKSVKGFTSMVAAGVVGSVLTLAVLPHTDYIKNFNNDNNNQAVSVASQPVSQAKPVSTQTASQNSIADTVQRVSKAIVGIDNYQRQQSQDFFGNTTSSQNVDTGSGSGVIIQKKDGYAYIVTNNHVVEGANKLEVSLYDGSKTSAQLVGTDALTDLAVLKIPGKYVNTIATFGTSSSLRPGDPVYAIGNPLGSELSRTVTQGIISATNRSISVQTSAGDYETTVIQTDAAINPGNSGGALINPEGQVIGINSMKIAESGVEGLGFAIPSDDVIPIVNQLIKYGKIERPYLGVSLADLSQVPQIYLQDLPNNVSNGVIVVNVDSNSAAGRAGIQPKDIIVSMDGTSVGNSAELRKFLYTKAKIGDTVKVGLYRNGKLMTVNVKLTSNANNTN
ncbi:S1C family serine protease [Neobacillus fumarioli]|uniref:S1C family serine protease n=1 Tax=Neobacillus fumarioli TaxID=105229 RepID=UPI000A02D693|nr:trypsin-like peptidase domain-containing protein [Neobacillus fumarioli]